MTSRPEILVRSGDRAEIAGSVFLSAVLHATAIALLLMIARRLPPTLQPPVSYTVDLVSVDRLGGTNLPGGGLQRNGKVAAVPIAAPPRAAAPPKEPAPPAASVENRASEIKREPVPPPEKAKAPEVKREPVPPPEKVKAPEVKPEAAPAAEKVKAPEVKREPVSPPEKAKAPEVKREPVPSAENAKPASSSAKTGNAEPGTAEDPAAVEARKRDQTILAAVQRRADAVTRGVGPGPGGGEGPMSVGPGTGAGGAVRGVEYLLYYNHMMTRIKESWAWAGQGGSLEAVVAFRITPPGEIVEVRTLRSSGDPTYDLSVERAVRGAGVLGPPPETYRSEFENGVEITFRAEDLRS